MTSETQIDEWLAYYTDRVMMMAWILKLAGQIKETAWREGSTSEIRQLCDEIKHSVSDVVETLYEDAADQGITDQEILGLARHRLKTEQNGEQSVAIH